MSGGPGDNDPCVELVAPECTWDMTSQQPLVNVERDYCTVSSAIWSNLEGFINSSLLILKPSRGVDFKVNLEIEFGTEAVQELTIVGGGKG